MEKELTKTTPAVTPTGAQTPAAGAGTTTQKPTKPAANSMEVTKKGTVRREAEIITRLKDKDAADGLYQIILQMTGGDTLFVDKFVQCCKMQVDSAWKRTPDGKGWTNPYLVIPINEQIKALYKCAAKRVLPDGYNCYLVPYIGRDEKRLDVQVDYKGIIDCLVKEGIIIDCGAKEVCANDDFDWDLGEVTRWHIDFRKARGGCIGFCSWAVLPSGRKKWEFMPLDEIADVRKCAKTEYVWKRWEGEMAKKTVIRRLFKTLPNTPKLRGLLELDNEAFDMEQGADGKYQLAGTHPQRKTSAVRQVVGHTPSALPAPEQPADQQEEQPPANEAELVPAQPASAGEGAAAAQGSLF